MVFPKSEQLNAEILFYTDNQSVILKDLLPDDFLSSSDKDAPKPLSESEDVQAILTCYKELRLQLNDRIPGGYKKIIGFMKRLDTADEQEALDCHAELNALLNDSITDEGYKNIDGIIEQLNTALAKLQVSAALKAASKQPNLEINFASLTRFTYDAIKYLKASMSDARNLEISIFGAVNSLYTIADDLSDLSMLRKLNIADNPLTTFPQIPPECEHVIITYFTGFPQTAPAFLTTAPEGSHTLAIYVGDHPFPKSVRNAQEYMNYVFPRKATAEAPSLASVEDANPASGCRCC